MQIQPDYSYNPYINFASSQRSAIPSALTRQDENSGTESIEYREFLRKASALLSNPDLSNLKRAQVLNLLARGQNAAETAAMGELSALFYEINRIDPEPAADIDPFEQERQAPQETPDTHEEDKITYKDRSGDANVSFKYPVALNEYQAPLAVMAHEGQHVILARARALMNDENVTSYVSYHYGYDSNGRLIITGGTTTTITRPKYEIESFRIGGNLDIYV